MGADTLAVREHAVPALPSLDQETLDRLRSKITTNAKTVQSVGSRAQTVSGVVAPTGTCHPPQTVWWCLT